MRPFDPRLLRHAGAVRAHLAVTTSLGVVTAGLVLAQAGLLAHALAAAISDGAGLPELRGPLVALAAVLGARAAVSWAQEVAAQRASASVKSSLRRRFVAHVVDLGPRHRPEGGTGELATLATRGLDALDGYFGRYLPQLVLAAVVPAAVLLRIAPADLVATVTIALTLPLIPVFMVLVGLTTEARNRRRWRALTRLSHHFLDVVAGLPTLKVFGRARAQADAVRRVTDEYRRETMATLRIAFLSSLVLELLATLSVALVAVGIGLRLVHGGMDLETALLVLLLAPEAYLPLRQVGANYHASAEGLAAAERVLDLLDAPAPERGSRTDVPDVRHGELRVDAVSVAHDGRDLLAPAGLSLTLRPGRLVALAGPSGTGKSTLLQVLLALRPPTAGTVEVAGPDGGCSLAELAPDAWRRHVGWVPQEPYLVPGTVADNVRLGAPTASRADVDAALRAAGLAAGRALPAGARTTVGERGRGLSAGQRRRVALARALLRDPDVLLLDEPTAGLDPTTEATVLATLREASQDRLVLLVSHRPAALAAADQVVVMPAPVPAEGVPA